MKFFTRACILFSVLSFQALAATNPSSGTITEDSPTLGYDGGPLAASSNAASSACDDDGTSELFGLTVTLPADFDERRPDDSIRVVIAPNATADTVISIWAEDGTVLADQDGPGPGEAESTFVDALPGTTNYTVLICLFAGFATSYHVDISLTSLPPPPPGGTAYAPRFQYILSPSALGNGAGEPSLGYNLFTKKGMYQAGLETLRVTFPENRSDDELNPGGLPQACDALWEDVSFPTTSTVSLDPIGLGDFTTGRYFASQLSAKSNNMAYTDDDGENWLPSLGNFPGAAGLDHQTVGWAPYNAEAGNAVPLTAYPNAIYYCSQDIAYANCSRSDDGGTTFLPPVITYNLTTCGGLHGHIRASLDGIVYLPNKGCGDNQAVVVSEDNGLNWEVRKIPTSSPGAVDPQIALAVDGTGYFCYVAGNGRPHVAVTHDKGKTWSNDFNIGTEVGVISAVFPQSIAGDPDRAACGFLGTTTSGNWEAQDFAGIWHPYIAVTYDGGVTWSTRNVSPGDPAQGAGGICMSGTTCEGDNRNLLDFNDMALDEKGLAMYGFADGCVGSCVSNPNLVGQFSEKAAISRIVGGKPLYANLDVPEPHVPQAACLAGSRTADSADLTWRAPADDGTSPITAYKIYRGTTQAAQSLLVTVSPKTKYIDFNTDPAEPVYFYKIVAVNALGDSVYSNLIKLPIDVAEALQSTCTPPGLTILEDPEGDIFVATGQTSNPGWDLRKLSLSQPYFDNGDYMVVFTLKVQDLTVPPPNTTWPIQFQSADGADYAVRMDTTAGPARFTVATGANSTSPTLNPGKPAHPASSYLPDGTITIIVNASDMGLTNDGAGVDKLSLFLVRVRVQGGVADPTPDNMPNSLGRVGEFATTTLNFCSPNTPPQAALEIDRQTGLPPLKVRFDASGSFDLDAQDTIAEYIFDFGDGTENIVQTTPVISHTYLEAGNYSASARVKDSRGLLGTAAAKKVIEVIQVGGGNAPTNGASFDNNKLGGAFAGLTLLGLGLGGLWRRRRSI